MGGNYGRLNDPETGVHVVELTEGEAHLIKAIRAFDDMPEDEAKREGRIFQRAFSGKSVDTITAAAVCTVRLLEKRLETERHA